MIRPGFGYTNAEYVGNPESESDIPPTREETDYSLVSSPSPTFSQLNPLLKLGYERPLKNGDLGTLPPDARMDVLVPIFAQILEQEKLLSPDKRSLWRVLVKTVGWVNIAASIGLGFVGSACAFAGPLLLKAISNHMTGQTALPGGDRTMWCLIGLVFVVPSVGSVATCHSNMQLNYFGIQVRNVLTSTVFEKLFRLRSCELESGEVVNIINVDIKAWN
jgi:hypothetical protein